MGVEHVSAYSLTYEAGTALERWRKQHPDRVIEEDLDLAMYEAAMSMLEKAGYQQYEISNFARPGFPCRHNLVYWANDPYIGLGPAAGSYWQGRRTNNLADLDLYVTAVENGDSTFAETHTPSPLETAWQTAVLNLRRITGIDLAEFRTRTGFDACTLFAEPIEKYLAAKLLERTADHLRLTRQARAIADTILGDFVVLEP